MSDRVTVTIGGVNIAIVPHSDKEFRIPNNCEQFVTSGKPEEFLHVWDCDAPHFSLGKNIFNSEEVSAYISSEGLTIISHAPDRPDALSKVIRVNPRLRSIDLYAKSDEAEQYFDPLKPYLLRILMINIFSQGLGALVHASGVNDKGWGMLFAGASGSGKSTIANLWKDRNCTVLGEDTIIIRKRKERFWMYGVPWKDDTISSPGTCLLENIFFIEHAAENNIAQEKDALRNILSNSLFPYWNKSGIEFVMDLLSELVKRIPYYNLGFVPNESIVDFIRSIR
jgi:hypothetical protein